MSRFFTLEEKIFMVHEYARNANFRDVIRKWSFTTPKPSPKGIKKVIENFKETGTVHRRKGQGRKKTIVVEENIEKVRRKIEEDPKKSCQRLSVELNISRSSVFRILRSLDLKPYRPTLCQELKAEDPAKRCIALLLIFVFLLC